ncbi:MAG: PHA/PHB synthase family protein [Actinomycetota bacterium]
MSRPPAVVEHYDPAAFGPVLAKMGAGLLRHPVPTFRGTARLAAGLAGAVAQSTAKALGWQGRPSLEPAPGDRRFSDPAFEESPWFLAQRQAYLAWVRYLDDLRAGAGLDGVEAEKAAVALDLVADAAAPTNTFWGNPTAVRKAIESSGASVVRGIGNFADDVLANEARPRQVDTSAFRLGENLGATPGKVVYRNELFELLQYEPATATVHELPLLLSPPWINKYYIMDLAPGRSFAEWAVSHGHTTFAISYRNPDGSMRDVDLQDYLLDGLGTAVEVVRDITGADEVNVAGLCVGGTLAVMLLAWLAQDGKRPVRSLTLLNTLVDFSRPGRLAAFTDAAAVERMERRMAAEGVLDGREMATTFDALRANDLIWNYVGANWLRGEQPPAFDILAWNGDSTRIPAATHSEYLRALYRENRLAGGTMTLAGRTLDLARIESETYVLAAREDHITPWKSSYLTTGLVGNGAGEPPVRFVLSSAGHIAGIVNPPGPKRRHWINEDLPATPEEWEAAATEHPGSWWEDWAAWIGARAGGRRRPPGIGDKHHPVLGDAPGEYVHG